jgi:sugar phosphate isomerase/epimerase
MFKTDRRGFLSLLLAETALRAQRREVAIANEFFAMDTAMVKSLAKDVLQQADIERLAALGYAGLGPVVPNAAAWQRLNEQILPWLDARKLKLYAVYSGLQVAGDLYTIDPELKRNLPSLKGRGTVIWLPIVSKAFKPSDPEGDALAVAAVREVADLAALQGLAISLYPHAGSLTERVSDAVRIADKTGRANVGVTFNLCHWLRTDGPDSMERVLKLALPRLSLVTINGADRDGKDWVKLIQPLDSGTFDVAAFLGALHGLGYRGPIGLQGYAVANNQKIEPSENLTRSMAAWKKMAPSRVAL